MALVLGVSSGFVFDAPTVDPDGTNTTIDGLSVVTKDTSPSGVTSITEIGWYRGTGSNGANFEVALYNDVGGVATTRLFVEPVNSSKSGGWIVVPVNWTISPNTPYWLGVQLDAHGGSSGIDTSITGGAGYDIKTSQTSLSDPYGGGAVALGIGMYAVYAKVGISVNITPAIGDASIIGFPPVWSTVFAGSSFEGLTTFGEAAIEGFLPALLISDNKSIFTGIGESMINGIPPTLLTSNNINVVADSGVLDSIGLVPIVFASDDKDLLPSLGDVLSSGLNPICLASDNKLLFPELGVFTIAGFLPTVLIGNNIEINSLSGVVGVIGIAPVVLAADNKNLLPYFGQFEINGLSPSFVFSDNKLILIDCGILLFGGLTPILLTTENIEVLPSFGEILFEGFYPFFTENTTVISLPETVDLDVKILKSLIFNTEIEKEVILKGFTLKNISKYTTFTKETSKKVSINKEISFNSKGK